MWLHCGVAHCGVAAALWFLLLAVGFYTSHSALGEGETGGMAVLAFPGWTTREGVPRLRLVSVLSPHLRLVSVSRIRGALWLCCQPLYVVGLLRAARRSCNGLRCSQFIFSFINV